MRLLRRLGPAFLLACCALAPALRAQSLLTFTDPAQLGLIEVATTANVALTHSASAGAGTPASGGLLFVPSGTGDDRVVSAWRTQGYDFSTATSFTTRALVHLGSITGEEGEIKLGFAHPGDLAVPPTDKDFLKKKGALTYLSGILKYKRKDGQIETLVANKADPAIEGSEFSKVSAVVTPAEMDAWVRLTLTVTPLAETPGSFSARLLIETLGADGTASPVILRDVTLASLPNASLASATAGRSALSLYTKKLAAAQLRFDDWQTLVPGPPPAAPVALDASLLGSTQFQANWETPAGGPSSYTVEVSTAANAFASGTLLAADGTPGQSAGFTVAAPATSATITGLSPATAYVYRVRAVSDNGPGPLSNTVAVSTLSASVNAPPTLDALADAGLVAPASLARSVALSGISAGPGEDQPLTVTATSSAPSIVPHPEIHYTSPAATGELRYLATGSALGTATITVTVSDGAASVSHAFTVTVRPPPESLAFSTATDLADELVLFASLTTPSWSATAGTGSPATGGLRVDLGSTAGDRLLAGWRTQPVAPDDATGLSTSLSFRFTGLVKEAETRVGFVVDSAPGSVVDKEFLKKNNGAHRSVAAFAKHKVEDNTLELGLLNRAANGDASEFKATLSGAAELVAAGDWLRLSLHLNRASADAYHARYVLEHLGPDGLATPTVVAESAEPVTLANAAVARSLSAHPVFLVTAKKEDAGPLFLDDHEALVLHEAPAAPLALAAEAVTATGLRAAWSYSPLAPYAAGYVLELSTAADAFAPGTLIAADGATGQATGIQITDTANPGSLVVAGLAPATDYVYRVRALNGSGSGPLSNVGAVTTLAADANAAPTLDALADLVLSPDSAAHAVALSDITTGGETGQTLVVTATSSAPAIVPHPAVAYASPAATGSLTLVPTGVEGSATITVTVSDGVASVSRAFVVGVRSAAAVIDFESAASLSEFALATVNATATHTPGAGVGSPAGGAVYFLGGSAGTDNSALFLRAQDFAAAGLTHLQTSLLLNPREINDLAVKNKAEVRLGFAAVSTAALPSDLKKFFEQDRASLYVRLQAEHSPTESKLNQLKLRLGAYDGSAKVEASELAYSDALGFEHWLRLGLVATPLDATRLRVTLRLEDAGADGLAATPRLIATQTVEFSLPALLGASRLQAGFALTTEKTVSTHGFWIDDHRVEVGSGSPAAPLVLAAAQRTASSFIAAWTPAADGPLPHSYVLEVSTAADAFASGTLLAADGTGGHSAGIVVADGATTQKITGLPPSTAYVYRVRGVNLAGPGDVSAAQPISTREAGANLAPTLDPVADVELALGTLDHLLTVTGIGDGGEDDQWLFVSATSSNPALIPDPDYLYDYPETTALLLLSPVTGATGSAVITVTVDDGQDNNPTFSRSFTVTVSEPEPLLAFATADDLARLRVASTEATLDHAADTSASSTLGALRFNRTANAQDHVAVAFRPTSYDARTAAAFEASAFVNLSEVAAITSNKDQGEVWLGFVTDDAPAATLKNTLHNTLPALGVKLRLQHEPSKADKLRLLEANLYQRTSSGTTNSPTLSLLDTPYATHWLRLSLHVVRSGEYSYQLHHTVDSWGADGAAFVARVFTSAPWTVTDANFALDDSIYAGLQFSGEKSRFTPFLADQWRVEVASVAPDAPPLLNVSAVTATSLGLHWQTPALGLAADGYVVELSRAADLFAPGTLIGASGQTGQTNGVSISGYGSTSAAFTGLAPATAYLWRVRAVSDGRVGPAFAPLTVTTADAPPEPGFATWRATNFNAEQLAADAISGPLADPDGDGLANLLEYAFGGSPLASDAALVAPQVSVVGDRLRLTYRRLAAASDLAYTPQAGADLADWTGPAPLELSASIADAEGFQTVVVEDTVNLGVAPRRFLRVLVARPE